MNFKSHEYNIVVMLLWQPSDRHVTSSQMATRSSRLSFTSFFFILCFYRSGKADRLSAPKIGPSSDKLLAQFSWLKIQRGQSRARSVSGFVTNWYVVKLVMVFYSKHAYCRIYERLTWSRRTSASLVQFAPSMVGIVEKFWKFTLRVFLLKQGAITCHFWLFAHTS